MFFLWWRRSRERRGGGRRFKFTVIPGRAILTGEISIFFLSFFSFISSNKVPRCNHENGKSQIYMNIDQGKQTLVTDQRASNTRRCSTLSSLANTCHASLSLTRWPLHRFKTFSNSRLPLSRATERETSSPVEYGETIFIIASIMLYNVMSYRTS